MPTCANEFLRIIVEPTVSEFIQSPHDLRRGLLAAIVLNHMADHIAQQELPADKRPVMNERLEAVLKVIRTDCPDFTFIQDVADATKHAKLAVTKPGKPNRSVSASDSATAMPGLFEVPFGDGVFSEASEVIVTLEDGSSKLLLPAAVAVLAAWRSMLSSNVPS